MERASCKHYFMGAFTHCMERAILTVWKELVANIILWEHLLTVWKELYSLYGKS